MATARNFSSPAAPSGARFSYTLFGQLVRGFDVLTNIVNTSVDTNDRPLADVIIQQAAYVGDTAEPC